MLTTSENNYKCSLFSFQRSCINQIVTQSIGIHLKGKIRAIKKTTKTKFISARVRKRSWLSTVGSKQLKSLWLRVLQGRWAQEACSKVNTNHSGEVFPIQQCFLLSPEGGWSTDMVQTGANEQDKNFSHWLKLRLWHRKNVAGAKGGKKADIFKNGFRSRVRVTHSAVQCFVTLSVDIDESPIPLL